MRAACARGSGRTSPAAASGPRSRRPWARWSASSGRETGSELEAALEELRLLRELRPPANARGTRPDRHVYLRLRGERWTVTEEPGPHGPIASRSVARRAAQALAGHTGDDPAAALEQLRGRVRRLAGDQRFEDAARARDRVAALERVVAGLQELDRLRALRACVVVPARQPGFVRAHALAGGHVAAIRLLPRGPGVRSEAAALVAEAARADGAAGPEDVDELRLVASFLRKPPPELRVAALERDAICALVDGIPLAA